MLSAEPSLLLIRGAQASVVLYQRFCPVTIYSDYMYLVSINSLL